MIKFICFILIVLSVGCGDQMSPDLQVIMDDQFTESEMSAVKAGIASWSSATDGQFTFHFQTLPHNSVWALADSKFEGNTIYAVRKSQAAHTACPTRRGVSEENLAEDHRDRWTGTAVICFDVDEIVSEVNLNDWMQSPGNYQEWQAIAAHETGHALKIKEHDSDPSALMFGSGSKIATTEPTCRDIARVVELWGMNLPKRCRQ